MPEEGNKEKKAASSSWFGGSKSKDAKAKEDKKEPKAKAAKKEREDEKATSQAKKAGKREESPKASKEKAFPKKMTASGTKSSKHKVRKKEALDSPVLGTVVGGQTVLVVGEKTFKKPDGTKVLRLKISQPKPGWVTASNFVET